MTEQDKKQDKKQEIAICPLTGKRCVGTPLNDYRDEGCVECYEAIEEDD